MHVRQPLKKTAAPKESHLFFQGIDFGGAIWCTGALTIAASLSHSLSDMNLDHSSTFPWIDFLRHVYRYAACAFLGWVFARKLGIQPMLLVRPTSWRFKTRILLFFGFGLGGVMGLIYYDLFRDYRFSGRVPGYLVEMEDHYDNFILSLRAAVTEELIFRFFLLTAFYYILKRLFHSLINRGNYLIRYVPLCAAFLLSGVLFGFAHGTFGFWTALVAGMILGGIFWWAGFETAVVTHFTVDYVFFSLTYVK